MLLCQPVAFVTFSQMSVGWMWLKFLCAPETSPAMTNKRRAPVMHNHNVWCIWKLSFLLGAASFFGARCMFLIIFDPSLPKLIFEIHHDSYFRWKMQSQETNILQWPVGDLTTHTCKGSLTILTDQAKAIHQTPSQQPLTLSNRKGDHIKLKWYILTVLWLCSDMERNGVAMVVLFKPCCKHNA